MLNQLRLSFQMTLAAFKMTARYPATILVALGNLAFLTFVAVGPLLWMIATFEEDPEAAYAILKYVYQFWIVDRTIPYDASGDVVWSQIDPGATGSALVMWYLVLTFLWGSIVTFGSLFTATVIMHTGVQQLKGQPPSLADGFGLAGRNVLRLAGLAVIAGFLLALAKRVLMALRVIPFVGRWIRRALIGAITATLYVVLPIVVYERSGVWSAFRSTWTNIRKTWGGLLVGTGLTLSTLWVGMWFVWAAVRVAFENLTGVEVIEWDTIVLLQAIGAVLLYCVNVALAANLRAALYLHVTEGHTGVIPDGAIERAPSAPPAPDPSRPAFQLRP